MLIALSFAVSLIITRSHRHISMAPATCLAQVLILVFAPPSPTRARSTCANLVLLILLGAGQIGLGLALLSVGARLIPAAEIATITLLEVVLGPLWVWIVVSERPSAGILVGGAIVVAGVLTQATGEPRRGGRRQSATHPDALRRGSEANAIRAPWEASRRICVHSASPITSPGASAGMPGGYGTANSAAMRPTAASASTVSDRA